MGTLAQYKKMFTSLTFCVIVSLLAGCETMIGSAKGAGRDLEPVTGGAKKGLQQMQKTDTRMQEVLW
jgi:hypothetical protein